jgi:hypothetical protein
MPTPNFVFTDTAASGYETIIRSVRNGGGPDKFESLISRLKENLIF